MKTVVVAKRIPVPADSVWSVIRTGAGMDRWVPAISVCSLEGEGVGARRVCVVDDHELIESIETVDDASRLFQYRIHAQSMMPVRDILGTIHVAAVGEAEAEVLWFSNFDLDDESEWPAVKAGIEALYLSGIEGLHAHLRDAV